MNDKVKQTHPHPIILYDRLNRNTGGKDGKSGRARKDSKGLFYREEDDPADRTGIRP
jgi:hypothetical protein